MILRRVIGHFRKQEWTAIALDFLIVVFGVYIGLQVQEWGQAQVDRKRELQIVADMLADLEIDRREYENGMELALRRVRAANASLIDAGQAPIEFEWEMPKAGGVDYSFDPESASGNAPAEQELLWTEIILGFFPTPSTSTYDAMVGAGDIKIIQDRALVRAIQVYRNRVGSVITQTEKQLSIRADSLSTGAAYGLAPYAKMPAADYFSLVASEPELAAVIRILGTFAIFHHGEMKSADSLAAELQARLASYLAEAR